MVDEGRKAMEITATIADDLTAFIRETFQVTPTDTRFGPGVHLWNEGYVDSLGITEVVSFIEERFHVRLPDDAFFDEANLTIAGMATLVAGILPAGAAKMRQRSNLRIRSFLWRPMS